MEKTEKYDDMDALNKEESSKEEGHTQSEEHKKKKKKDELIEELTNTIAEKERRIKELEERLLYLQADFENFKKLKSKERQDLLRFGNEALIKELLPVIDNLERAIAHIDESDTYKAIREGIQLALNEFLKVLERAGVTRIDAIGKRFDPNLHEAFFQEERTDVEPGTVIAEHQKGYMLNGRLIRPSLVSISKMPEENR